MQPTQHLPVDTSTPADILRRALTYLARYGWSSDYLDCAENAATEEIFPPLSVLGAVRAAVCGHPSQDLIAVPDHESCRLIDATQEALCASVFAHLGWRHADPVTDLIYLVDWFDHPATDPAGIRAALRRAADDWDHTHPVSGVAR